MRSCEYSIESLLVHATPLPSRLFSLLVVFSWFSLSSLLVSAVVCLNRMDTQNQLLSSLGLVFRIRHPEMAHPTPEYPASQHTTKSSMQGRGAQAASDLNLSNAGHV